MRFLTGNKLFDGKTFLPEGAVLVIDAENNFKEIITKKEIDQNQIEYFDGIITPGFVNAHCHLELSHLKGKIPRGTGLPDFAKDVIKLRNGVSKDKISEHMQAADEEMWQNGIVAVGDISNGDESFTTKRNSKIFYHTFIELIGLNPKNCKTILDNGIQLLEILNALKLSGSLAPHAPYSVSLELIKLIADYNSSHRLPFSIHNQESNEETNFFKGNKSKFYDLYAFLNLDISWFKAPNMSSLESYVHSLNDTKSILVHNTFTTAEDISLTQAKPIFWCFCPGANSFIENSLPDFSLFEKSDSICIGTDSLASNTQLNVLEEANFILKQSNSLSLEKMLKALTFNGAEALGISNNFGQFISNKNAGLNLVSYQDQQLQFIKKIV